MHLPPALAAVIWLDAVCFAAAVLAYAGMPPELEERADAWSWLAIAGSTLTAVAAALGAFGRGAPDWRLPVQAALVPALVLWAGASVMGCALPGGEPWGRTIGEAARCIGFLLGMSAPLLALLVFLLWEVAPRPGTGAVVLGALAASGAAASLLTFVHPHAPALLDLGAHALGPALVLAGAVWTSSRWRRKSTATYA